MDNLFGFVEAFYSRFILRDMLAKIVPGFYIIIFILVKLSLLDINQFKEIGFFVGAILLLFSWVMGFAVQALGEKLNLIKYHLDDRARLRYVKFIIMNPESVEKDLERIVVIKEACGNSYVSLLFLGVLYSVDKLFISGQFDIIIRPMQVSFLSLYIIYGFTIYSLRHMHYIQLKNQDYFVKRILQSKKCKNKKNRAIKLRKIAVNNKRYRRV